MTFGILVGVAIVTGFAGAVLEPVVAGLVGPVLGFIVTVSTEAALFTTLSYYLVEKHPTLAGLKHEFIKNVVIFGVLKGVSKGWGALEKVLGVEMKEGEMLAQFATVNGIALYQANQEKAKRGETLTEGEILKISFDNLIFMIAVAIGGKAVAPAFGRWRLKNAVGKSLARFESLHREVMDLAEAVKANKDRAVGDKLIERQRELIEAEREFVEGLLELTRQGWDHAKKQGMTREQFDAIAAAEADLAGAARGLREAEIMATLEPVTQGQYLCEPGKAFDDAHKHYAAGEDNVVGDVTKDGTGARVFEVTLPDGSKLRISERAGKPGEVGTDTHSTATSGGEPAAPRVEEVAKAHGITEAPAVKALEALYKLQPDAMLDFLDALKEHPGLASRLLAQFGEATLKHFKPIGDGMLSIHGEIDISAGKLGTFSEADMAKLVELGKNKGPEDVYAYFETTSTNEGKPGSRLRFRSRLESRAKTVVKNILESLGIKPGDARAELFEHMTEGDAIRLWDLSNERGYKDAAIRKQAADWAFSKHPSNAREFVAEMQFYDAEVSNQAAKLFADTKAELAIELDKRAAAKGSDLTPAEIKAATKAVTTKRLGRALDAIGPAANSAATARTLELMGEPAVGADGHTPTTVGAEAADVAWNTNIAAQSGPDAAGAKSIGIKTDAELAGHVQSVAETLAFGNEADGAYHAHKHAKELKSPTTAANEMATYLDAARAFIRDNPGVVRQNQNGSRSVVFEAGGMRAIVAVSADGNAVIATFGKS